MQRSWISWLMFIMVFLGIYGGAHALIYFKAKSALGLQGRAAFGLLGLVLVLVLSPFAERILDRAGQETPARVFAYVGYIWMGMIWFMLSAYAGLSVLRGVLAWLKKIPALSALGFSDAAALGWALGLAAAITLYGHFEAWAIRTERVVVPVSRGAASGSTIRIVQISDVHLGLINRDLKFKRIAELIRKAQPDLLVSTGDLVDGEIGHLEALVPYIRDIQPRLGKYAVTGNHEFYAGIEPSLKLTRDMGFTVLRNERVHLPGGLDLVGVDDPAVRLTREFPGVREAELMGAQPAGAFTVLLKHQPHIEPGLGATPFLQLSGHTHDGQVFPFVYLTRLAFPAVRHGLNALGAQQWLYISRGTGTWGPPVRFLAPPEITVIELQGSPAAAPTGDLAGQGRSH